LYRLSERIFDVRDLAEGLLVWFRYHNTKDITTTLNSKATKMEVVKDVESKGDDSEGYEGSEGSRICGFIIE